MSGSSLSYNFDLAKEAAWSSKLSYQQRYTNNIRGLSLVALGLKATPCPGFGPRQAEWRRQLAWVHSAQGWSQEPCCESPVTISVGHALPCVIWSHMDNSFHSMDRPERVLSCILLCYGLLCVQQLTSVNLATHTEKHGDWKSNFTCSTFTLHLLHCSAMHGAVYTQMTWIQKMFF